jgi:putative ABC transport system permease protein
MYSSVVLPKNRRFPLRTVARPSVTGVNCNKPSMAGTTDGVHPLTNLWLMAWRALWRDARAGELRLLWVAVALGVAALTSVGFLADRIEGGLQRDARQLLGGDAVVASDHDIPKEIGDKAQLLGLRSATTLSFPTMARSSSGASRLVALKAVTQGYPLRGHLQIDRPVPVTDRVPAQGEVWVEPALMEALELKLGQELSLGERRLRIAEVLLGEPDKGAGFMNFAPRVMMNQADLPATQLVQPASRINWRLAVMGPSAKVSEFVVWADAYVKQPEVRGMRVETLEAGRPEMRQTLDRAEKFLHLVALLAALLSAVAVALAARGFAARHLDDCAMLRVLGQSQQHILTVYVLEFFTVGLLASGLGLLLGFGLHQVFISLLAGLVETDLPAPGMAPFWQGLGSGLTLLAAFGLPPILQLAQVPALRVIRRDMGPLRATSLGVMGLGLLGFSALLLSASRDVWLGLMVVARICRCGTGLCRHGMAGGDGLAPSHAAEWLARVVAHGNTANQRPPGLYRGASQCFVGGFIGSHAAGVVAYRFGGQLAQRHTSRCTRTVLSSISSPPSRKRFCKP